MRRSHFHPSRCKVCGKKSDEAERISQTGLCGEHARERLLSNIEQMHERSGPNFHRWRRAMAACVGGVLVDDLIRDE